MFSNKTLKEKVFNKHKEDPEVMPKSDAMAILGYLDKVKTKYPVVEIGTWKGKTAAMIADYLKLIGKKNKVITIDPFSDFWKNENPEPEARERLKNYNVEIVKGFSIDKQVLDKIKNASLIFVDGGHDKESVKSDILNYFPKCKEYFLMHDINYQGVKDALEELNLNIKVISDSGGNTGVGLLETI
jgi:cephalosporin hydroxylase